MHLADRRGGDRRRLEFEEEALERVAQILLDHPLASSNGNGRTSS